MSRLTSRAPFNRPSAFDVLPSRPAPLSPPETEMEATLAIPYEPRQDDANSVSPESAAQPVPMSTESPGSHIRRVSSLAYTTNILSRREPRTIQRQSRWLVMVVPPASLTREPPTLGHTLSSAPAGRFVNGILMPLFPTLYGQLTAIAREFNMPSTTGLCIYLQLSESGASMMTPRVSDESWQMLWSHFFVGDDRAAPFPPHGLPISGRIEFDIDLRRARWFDTWMGNGRRDRGEAEVISGEPSMVSTHWRGDSRTSLFPTEMGADEYPSDAHPPVTAISSRTVTQRAVPRPLLLERRDAPSSRSFSRPASRGSGVPQETSSPDAPARPLVPSTELPKALSPVAQELEEPQTARKVDVQTKVREWRQSSSVNGAVSNALAAAGQPSLDPVNMPSGADVELDLDDFQWSISSAGPPSESAPSAVWPSHPPSVHLTGRMQGSVCLTPSIATSFGPLDDDWLDSPVSCVSRRPSPDLGMRMLDYVPLTPTTATSWGPDDSSSLHSDFELEYYAPSVDIGVRGMGSRPVTPSTATSWGPPDSPLLLPPSPELIHTPDSGERAFLDLQISSRAVPAPVFPYYSAWETEPWGHVWPYQAHRRRESRLIEHSMPECRTRSTALLPGWPDFGALYPSDPATERAAFNTPLPVELPRDVGYPHLDIYPTAYPYNLEEIYPACPQKGQVHRIRHCGMKEYFQLPEWPDFASLYPSNPKADRAAENKSQSVTLLGPVGYPFLEVYPTAYPYNLQHIYPANMLVMAHTMHSFSRTSEPAISKRNQLSQWPDFASLYPADPGMERAAPNKSLPVTLQHGEDHLYTSLHGSVYPHNLEEIYSAVSSASLEVVSRPPDFKVFEKFSPTRPNPEYPQFAGLYPSDPTAERVGDNKSLSVGLPALGYPFVSIYPLVYPWNLADIYGPSQMLGANSASSDDLARGSNSGLVSTKATSPRHNAKQTRQELHHGVFESINDSTFSSEQKSTGLIPSRQRTHDELRQTISTALFSEGSTGSNVSADLLRSATEKRNFKQLYPQYPDFTALYPSDPKAARAAESKSQTVDLTIVRYPFITVYPSVYPWNLADIYGPVSKVDVHAIPSNVNIVPKREISVRLPVHSGYPTFNLYPIQNEYPSIEIYPPVLPRSQISPIVSSSKLTPGYPTIELYEPVYPHLIVYPQTQLNATEVPVPSRPNSPRKRKQTPGPGRHRSYGQAPLSLAGEPEKLHRLSRSPVQKELTLPPVPVTSPDPMPAPRRPRLTHLELHRRAFGTDSGVKLPEQQQAAASRPAVRRRKTHDELRGIVLSDLSQEGSQRLDDIDPDLPPRSNALPASSIGQRSRSGTVSTRESSNPSHHVSQQLDVAAGSSSLTVARQRGRSGTVSSRASSDLPTEVSQALHDAVSELPRSVPTNSLAASRQRSRSGTVSNRASQPPAPPPSFAPPLPPTESVGGARRSSLSTSVKMPLSEVSPSISSTRLSPNAPLIAMPQYRTRSHLPASPYPMQDSNNPPAVDTNTHPVRQSNVLSRVRSMNTSVRPVDTSSRSSVVRLDRSKSLSETSERSKNRQSIVLDRAKMFTVTEDGIEVSDVLPAFPHPPMSRPVSKLDRSKLPFQ